MYQDTKLHLHVTGEECSSSVVIECLTKDRGSLVRALWYAQ